MTHYRGLNYLSESKGEFQLDYSTGDPISSVHFPPGSSQFLLVSSWDSSVSLAHIPTNSVRLQYFHKGPVLDACFQNMNLVYSGGLDCTLKLFDINSQAEQVIGHHEDAIRNVVYCPGLNSILTGGWDKMVKMWDPRMRRNAGSFLQPEKVYAVAVCGEKFIVGTKDRKICIWDLRSKAFVLQKRESSLKYQTRSIKCFPDNERFALSSIEGRVAVEYLDTNPEVQRKKYAFKCHRIKENGVEKIYPVNTISFHEKHNTFATGGSDGYVNMWDSGNKKRLCQFHRYPASISSIAFSQNGSMLAIACSYLYDEPALINPPPSSVFVRFVSDLETKPK